MKQLITIFSIGIILAGCEKSKEQLGKLILDNTQIANRVVHKYTFNESGKIKSDHRTSYQYMAGVPFDSITSATFFEYNKKGQLVSTFELPDSTREIRLYNNLDSLIAEYRINGFGDTTHMAVTKYDDNRIVRRINRFLSMRLPEDFSKARKEDLRNYDTMIFITDLIYDEGVHVKSLSRDKNGIVIEEIETYYENNRETKSITYTILGDTKYIKETTYYGSENSNDYPDSFSIGTLGDTVAVMKTFVKTDGKITMSYNSEFSIQDFFYYNTRGQLIAAIVIHEDRQEKDITKYTYDHKGNKIEEISYSEKISSGR